MMTATVSFGIGHSRFSMSSLRPEGLTPEDHCALLADETCIFVEGTMKAKTQEDGKNKTSNLGIIESISRQGYPTQTRKQRREGRAIRNTILPGHVTGANHVKDATRPGTPLLHRPGYC